ncbi:MAG: GDP-L-fucose synthase [Anaerohalosphaera sp.]|nr:GDP-L-fucose synthase [Anaerohalosphaera sp.]
MFKDSRIFVAGHSGLLGSAMLKELGKAGYSNLIYVSHRHLDLTDKSAVFDYFSQNLPEYVFLAAGKVGGIADNKAYPASYLHVNLAIQDNVFEAACKFEVKNVVFYASSCTYPRNCPQPMKEEHLLTGPIEPTSQGYAAAKIAGLFACRSYNDQYDNRRFIALLPNTIYGPYDNFDLSSSHVLPALIRRFYQACLSDDKQVTLWGTGDVRREFVFSEDVARASIFAVENVDMLENCHYNVGCSADHSIKELAEKIAVITGYRGSIVWDTTKQDGAPRKMLDCTRFQGLGWMPEMNFDNALKLTYDWFVQNYSEIINR